MTCPRRAAVTFGLLALLSCALATAGWAAKEFLRPRAMHARTYPAHDEHPQEKVTVAAEPYDTPEKLAIFVSKYQQHHLLPVFVVISNDGDQPVALNGMKLELVTAQKTKIEPSDEDQIDRRFGREARRKPKTGPRVGLPIPLPRRSGDGGREQSELDLELDAAMFHAKAVEPHATQAGFVFFDVTDLSSPLEGAHFFASGIRTGDGQELYFFELSMDKYLGTKSAK